MGQAPPGSIVHSGLEQGLPFIQGNAEFGSIHPRPTKSCDAPPREAREGDILLSVRAPVGAMNRAAYRLGIGRGLAALGFHGLDRQFAWYAVGHEVHGLTRLSQGSTFEAVNKEAIASLLLPVPPLPEQRKIGAILSAVDKAIEATQTVIERLRVVRQAMMTDLLVRGPAHGDFKPTEWGPIPQRWEVARLGDVCERMFVGIAQATTHAYVQEGGVPLIRTTNVKPNRLDGEDILQIDPNFATAMSSKALRAGDVLSARTGYPGVSVVVPTEYDGAQCFTLLVSRPGPRLLPSISATS